MQGRRLVAFGLLLFGSGCGGTVARGEPACPAPSAPIAKRALAAARAAWASGDAPLRSSALAALVDLRGPCAAPVLGEALGDGDASLRGRAARLAMAAGVHVERARKVARALLSAPTEPAWRCPVHPHQRGEAGESCPVCGLAFSPPAAPPAWTCPFHPEVRADGPEPCPVCGMELVEQPPPPPEIDDWRARVEAAWALALAGEEAGVERLVAIARGAPAAGAAGSEPGPVTLDAAEAAIALFRMADRLDPRVYAPLAGPRVHPVIARHAQAALAHHGDPAALAALRTAARAGEPLAVHLLGHRADPADRPLFRRLLAREGPLELRCAAAEAMARQGDRTALDHLVAAHISHPPDPHDPGVWQCMAAAAEVQVPELLVPFAPLLDAPTPGVRAAATELIARAFRSPSGPRTPPVPAAESR